jgi:hypothetical protein
MDGFLVFFGNVETGLLFDARPLASVALLLAASDDERNNLRG